jgi:hypothetical protein
MTSLKTIAAAALLSALSASPVFAQAAISEPGAFSFYHPDRDPLNGGRLPWTQGQPVQAPSASDAYAAVDGGVVIRHSPRHRSHRAHRLE